jgi:4-alpha-glucanotransferase
MPEARDREGDRRSLHELARAYGVQTSYRDVTRKPHRATVEGLLAVLRALGVEIDSAAEAGRILSGGGATGSATGAAEPANRGPALMPQIPEPAWATFLPLYALRARNDWGVGSFTDLAALCGWTRGLGGAAIGTLPLLAQFLDEPFEYSPYSPASRMFWNELYVDLTAVPEMAASRRAGRLAESTDRTRLSRGRLVDYRAVYAAKRPVLEALSAEFFANASSARQRAFDRFRREHPELDAYARFRAFGERTGLPWQRWPAREQGGRLQARDVDLERERFHQYVQFVADEEIAAIGSRGPGDGLLLDMPLGVHGASFDTWRFRDSFAFGVSGGAPADPFFPKGQDWGFPPLHPRRMRQDGFAYVRACLRHLCRHAGLLRIDHIMGFHRLFWVPGSLGALHGVYVRYPAEELYAVLAEEANRAGTVVVGEDLGTVPPGVRPAMRRHGVLRSHVVELEAAIHPEDPLRPVPRDSVASLNTHDLAPFAAFWEGADIDDRHRQGLIDEGEARRQRRDRRATVRLLAARLRVEGRLLKGSVTSDRAYAALLEHLAAGPAGMVVVNLEDLWGETEPQNRPGTWQEQPSWRRRAKRTFESFTSDPAIVGRLRDVDRLRRERGRRPREDPT